MRSRIVTASDCLSPNVLRGSAYNSIPPSGVHHNFVMMDSMGQPPGYRRTVPQMQRDNYAPPPLIPVQHLNGSMRYEPPHTPQPPRTPQPPLTPQPPHTPQPSHTPQPQIFGGDVVDLRYLSVQKSSFISRIFFTKINVGKEVLFHYYFYSSKSRTFIFRLVKVVVTRFLL